MSELTKLKNLGYKTAQWLHDIGIHTGDDIAGLGAVEVYKRLKDSRPGVSVLALYALQGALMDLHWNQLPEDVKADLIRQLENDDS